VRALRLLFWLLLALGLGTAPALAGPPYQTDDPDPTDYRHYEIYVFATDENDVAPTRVTTANLPSLEVNYGLMPNVQFSVDLPFGASRSAGGPLALAYDDTSVGLKVRFLQEAPGRPQVAFYPSIELPTGDPAAGIGSALPKTFLPLWGQKTNGSWTYFGGGGVWHNPGIGNRDYTFTGFAATDAVRPGTSLGVEVYHQTPDTRADFASTSFGLGFVQARGEHHAILASFGRALGRSPSFYGYAAYALYLGPPGAAGSH
jgi:hypothetical protein